jgi:hypothetical protein
MELVFTAENPEHIIKSSDFKKVTFSHMHFFYGLKYKDSMAMVFETVNDSKEIDRLQLSILYSAPGRKHKIPIKPHRELSRFKKNDIRVRIELLPSVKEAEFEFTLHYNLE